MVEQSSRTTLQTQPPRTACGEKAVRGLGGLEIPVTPLSNERIELTVPAAVNPEQLPPAPDSG